MTHTVPAILQADGQLRFLEPPPFLGQVARKVFVTFSDPETEAPLPTADWQQFAGALRHSPNLNGDPLTLLARGEKP